MLDPVLLFFLVGVLAGLLKSDLRIPESFYHVLSIYLLFSIGIKGGIETQHAGIRQIIFPLIISLALGVMNCLLAIGVLKSVFKFSLADSTAMGAHYGSVSAVTFAVVCSFVEYSGNAYEKYLTVMLVAMEIPSIWVAILWYRKQQDKNSGVSIGKIMGEVLSGKSMICLLGGLFIGYYIGWSKNEQLNFFFVDLFKGFLGLFMLEMGLVASERMHTLKGAGVRLIFFALLFPLLTASLGIWAGWSVGLSIGGATVLAAMSASASYIAAPAAVRLAIPEANPALYLTGSLGITFPFNLLVGIPLYYQMAKWWYG